ncbi:MAG: hypothetical protein ABL962_05610 [Fimbriimonadaceae bacterium]
MPRRRELKSVASGWAAHCVSRNNDIAGYWALGIIYRSALETGTDEVRVAIMSDEPLPEHLKAFRQSFRERSTEHRLSHFIQDIVVVFRFELYSMSSVRGPLSRAICTVHIIDDLNVSRTATASTFCYTHDPRSETKSTRG